MLIVHELEGSCKHVCDVGDVADSHVALNSGSSNIAEMLFMHKRHIMNTQGAHYVLFVHTGPRGLMHVCA
jgi:hypothetical protein